MATRKGGQVRFLHGVLARQAKPGRFLAGSASVVAPPEGETLIKGVDMNEYQDQSVWYELYALRPEAAHIFQRSEFVEDFDTYEQAEAYAKGYFEAGESYRIKRVAGLAD